MSTVLSPGQVVESISEPTDSQTWRENLNVHMICPECREYPPNIVENQAAGDTVCGSCGLVLADRLIDEHSEWRTFAKDETGMDDLSRAGRAADPFRNGSQLETSISFGDGSSGLQRAHGRMNDDTSRKTLKEAYAHIAAICNTMNLTEDAISFAQLLFKSLEDAKALKGKNQQSTIAGCIFISCRHTNHTRMFQDITDATKVSKKELYRALKSIENFSHTQRRHQQSHAAAAGANIPHHIFDNSTDSICSANPAEICEKFCQRLLLDKLSTRVSKELAENLSSGGALAGRNPLSAAAACIYMASHLMSHPKSPKDIAHVVGISNGTIRTSYKLLHAEKDSLIERSWLEQGGDISKLPAA